MQLVVTAPAPTAQAEQATEIKWVAKGGSSINSADGRFALRKNSKGTWKVLDNGKELAGGLTKDEAKAEAAMVTTLGQTDLKASLLAGTAKVHSVRGNGTLRRRHYLVGEALAAAEQVVARREAGDSLAAIAKDMHSSVSYVRRMLVDLAITQELNAMQEDELSAIFQGAGE